MDLAHQGVPGWKALQILNLSSRWLLAPIASVQDLWMSQPIVNCSDFPWQSQIRFSATESYYY